MDVREQVQRGLRRLKQAMARIEADMAEKAHVPLDPPIAQEDRNIIIDLIRLAIWEEKEQDRLTLRPTKKASIGCGFMGKNWRMCQERKTMKPSGLPTGGMNF